MWSFFRYYSPEIKGVRRLDHVREQLVSGVVYFPRPTEFEDPIDCRPTIVPATPAQSIAYATRAGARRHPGKHNRGKRREAKGWMQKRAASPESLRSIEEAHAKTIGVLSLSTTKCNAYLWERYAGAGAGVCVAYDLEGVIMSGNKDWIPLAVTYVDEPPELAFFDHHPPRPEVVSELFRISLTTKTRRWAIEEEVRVIMPLGDLDPPKVEVPRDTIRGLYLGPRLSAEDRTQILSWDTEVPVFDVVVNERGMIIGFQESR